MMSTPIFRVPPKGVRRVPAFALVLACAACGEAPPPAGPAPPLPRATERTEAGADGIEVAARYPSIRSELAPLDAAMRAYTQRQRDELAARIGRLKAEAERAERPAKLDLDFTVATQTVDFVSALAQGQAELGGGAPPTPLRATFTEHLPSGRIVALGDLFADPAAAFKIFSDEVRRRLGADFEARLRALGLADKELEARLAAMRERIEKGSEPAAENFAAFLVDGVDGKAIGLTLIFPPGQVAAEVDGAQQVEVPVKLFAAAIKPEYRDAFDRESAATPAPVPGSGSR